MDNILLPLNHDPSIEQQIEKKQKVLDFEIREYPVGVLVGKYTNPPEGGLETDEPELYVPDYQRDYIWSDKQKSEFIESLIINLPVPYLYVADNKETGRIEIIDGSQRIRTLEEFVRQNLMLSNLTQIPSLNGYTFNNLPRPTRMRFLRKTMRMIELSYQMDEEGRRELFRRLNSGGTLLKDMEKREGIRDGAFLQFINRLSENELFKQLCPISATKLKHGESRELVLRFFAYLDEYENFIIEVYEFLDNYLDKKNKEPVANYATQEQEFLRMLNFIQACIPMGFRKRPNDSSVPRIRFEALAIGAALALRENPQLQPPTPAVMQQLLNSKELLYHTCSDASNSKPRVKARLELVRDFLLGRPIAPYSPHEIKNAPSKLQLGLYTEDEAE